MIHKFSLFPFRRPAERVSRLPMDFGTMYFLYPSENSYMGGTRSSGWTDRIIGKAGSLFRKKEKSDTGYYKNEFFSYF